MKLPFARALRTRKPGRRASRRGTPHVRGLVGHAAAWFDTPRSLILEPLEERTYLAVDLAVGLNSNEPNIAVDPYNSNLIAVAQFRTVEFSFDRGATFPFSITVNAPNGYAGAGGDASLSFDSQHRLYFSYLASNPAPANPSFKIGVFAARIDVDFSAQSAAIAQNTAIALESATFDHDKEWVAADYYAGSPYKDNAYVVWTRLGGASQILFSRTTDGGATWSASQQLDNGTSGFVWPSDVAVAPNGDVWTAWHTHTADTAGNTGEVRMRRSVDAGATFQAELANLPFTAGNADTNDNAPPNPRVPGLLSWLQGSVQPRILTDPVHPGTLYVVAADDPDNTYASGDDSDIVFARSTDNGANWTTTTISHGPVGTLQIMPAAAIDEFGNIAVTWYDNRRGLINAGLDGTPASGDEDFLLDIYATVSRDGGLTFTNDFRLTDTAFDPDLGATDRFPPSNVLRIGEYFGLAARDGTVFATWTGNTVAGQQIFFDKFNMLGPFADPSEPNDTLATAAILGSLAAVTLQDRTLNTDDSVDYYKYTAHDTGKLVVNIYYDSGVADVDQQVLDAKGNVIASGVATNVLPGLDQEHLVIPVVAGQEYFIKVFPNNPLPNPVTYDLEIENFPIPVPTEVVLDPADDSGPSNLDNVTSKTTSVHFFVEADLSDFAAEGVTILSPAQAAGGLTPGAAVQVFVNGAAVGYATVVAGSDNTLFEINLNADLVKFSAGGPNAAGALGYPGFTNLITSAVRIFDGQKNGAGAPAPATNRGPLSSALRVIFDNTAPLAPSVPDLLASSDTGALSTDNYTGIKQPAFSGTGEANTRIRILAGGVVVGQGVVGSDATDGVLGNGLGAWEVTVEPLADGTYNISAQLDDTAGNLGPASATLSVTIDTLSPQRPTIDLVDSFDSGISDKDNITNQTTLDFLVSAQTGSNVVIKDGNTVIDTFVMPAGAFTTRSLILANGPHPLSAEATDTAGNRSAQSVELLVTVDTVAPAAPSVPDLLASSDTGSLSTDNITAIKQPAFSGTGEVNTRIRILANGVVVGQGVVGSDATDGVLGNGLGAWEVTVEPLADGTYDISAQLDDTAGNLGPASATLSVTIDTLPPQRPTIDLVDSFDSGWSDKDNITRNTNLDFTVTGQVGAMIVIKDGNTVIDSFVMPALVTTRSLVLANGPHPLSAEATDTAGNRSAQSEELLVTVDTVAPAAPSVPDLLATSDSGASSTDNNTNIKRPAFFGTGEVNTRVFLFANNLPVGQGLVDTDLSDLIVGNGLGTWEVTVEPLVDGVYSIIAVLEDAAGNFSLLTSALAVTIDTLAPQRPTIDLLSAFDTGSSDIDNVTDLNALSFRVSAEAGTTVVIKDGETVIDTFVMPGGGFTTRALLLADGPHPLSAEATDTAGNRSAQSQELLVMVDSVPPAPPSTPDLLPSSDSGMSAVDNITNVNPPAFQGTGEANAKVRILADGVVIGEGVVGSDGTDGILGNGLGHWEVTVEPLTDGTYSITAVLEDLAGNISQPSEALILVLDTTAPQRPTIDLIDAFDTGMSDKDNVTYLHTLNFLVSAEAGATVVIKDGNTVIDMFVMPAVAFTIRTLVLADGPHPLSAEATDTAGNRSHQSEELLVTVDSVGPPAPSVPDLLASSDTGTFNDDNVTRLQALAFQGTGEANAKVRIFANGLLVGQGVVGTDLTNPPEQLPGNPPAIGHWEVTTEPLGDGTWTITVEVEDQAGNITVQEVGLLVYVDTVLPNTPYLDLTDASDTGRNNHDNLTFDNTPTVTTTADDVQGAASNAFPHDVRYRIFDRAGTGPDVLLVDSFATIPGLSTLKFFTDTLSTLADGVHNLKLEVEDRAGNVSHAFLLSITIDTAPPPVFFGLALVANDGLDPGSDSGVVGDTATFSDRITNVIRPSFWGTAEANALIRMFADAEHLIPLGQAVAIPLDGNLAFPNGQWNLTSILDLNNPAIFPHDGLRTIYVTAEDPAGNVSSHQLLNIFLDTQGPQVTGVSITDHPNFNLFGLKPGNASQGPTPLIFDLTINLQDFPLEDALFLRAAIERAIAGTAGVISLRGDHNGLIAIDDIIVSNATPVAGQVARATIRLVFNRPLPDDRYTLTIADTLPDIAGNRLDGENNAIEPNGFPLFPSGDGQPGGNFVARFTVDSRDEIGTYAAASIYIDINGNLLYDPQGQNNDETNRDLTFGLGIVPSLQGVVSPMGIHDGVFAGNFPGKARGGEDLAALQQSTADGFDKLAAYGYDATARAFRWLIDTNNDGIIDPAAGDHATIQPAGFQINGLPIAGDFDGNPDNGDEIGLFDGTRWYFDTNHNYIIDAGDLVRTTSLRGSPIVGDFNGDGIVDLATWRDDHFYFNFGTQPGGAGTQPDWSGSVDATISWGLPGNAELPVAGDIDGDGITDIGLFLPPRTGTLPLESGNWQFLISNDFAKNFRGGKQVTALNHPFSPAPLGNDLFAQFGDAFALPIVGNFDPPVAAPKLPTPVAMSAVLGSMPMGTHSINGDEWYSFSALRNGTILVDAATSAPATQLTANLYDANYRLVGSSSATAVSRVTLQGSVVAGQTYLLRLSGDHATANIKLSNQVPDIDRCDTSRDGIVSAIDALRIINELIAKGMTVTPLSTTDAKLYLDTNLDGRISAIDVLQVINYLIAHPVPSAQPHAAVASATAGGSAASTGAPAPGAGSAIAFGLSVGVSTESSSPLPAAADTVYAQLATAPLPLLSAPAMAGVASDVWSSDSDLPGESLVTDPDWDWLA